MFMTLTGDPFTPATMSKQRSTMSKQHSTLLPQTATISNDSIVKFRFFDNDETNWACSICFDFVERTKFRSTLMPKTATLLPEMATMSKQHSTLSKESFNLKHWTAVFAGFTRWQTTLLVGNNSRAHSGEAKFCYLYGYKVFFLSHWSIYPILNQLDPLPHSHTVQFRRPRAYWWLWRGLCVCLFIVGGGAIGSARSSWWEKSCCFSGCIRWRHRKTVGSVESFVVIAAVDWVYSALH